MFYFFFSWNDVKMKYEPRSFKRMSGSIKICYMINWCCHEFLWDDLRFFGVLEFFFGRVTIESKILYEKIFSYFFVIFRVFQESQMQILCDTLDCSICYMMDMKGNKKMLAFWMSDFWCLNYVCKSIMCAKSRKILFLFLKILLYFLLINSTKIY